MLVLLGKWGDTLLLPVVHITVDNAGGDSWRSAGGHAELLQLPRPAPRAGPAR